MPRNRFVAFATLTCSLAAQGFALAQQTQAELPAKPVPAITGALISEAPPGQESGGHLIIRTPDGQVRRINLPQGDGTGHLSIVAQADKDGNVGMVDVGGLPKYVIGVSLSEVPASLRAHITLPEGHGVLVGAVVPESPAAQGGLQQHDILLKSGDRELKAARDLQEIVDSSEGKPVSITLQRKGEQKTVELTPVKREELKFTAQPDLNLSVAGPGAFLLPQGVDPTVLNLLQGVGAPGNPPDWVRSTAIHSVNTQQINDLSTSIQKLAEQIERLQKSVDRLEGTKSSDPPAEKVKENGGALKAPRPNLTTFISIS